MAVNTLKCEYLTSLDLKVLTGYISGVRRILSCWGFSKARAESGGRALGMGTQPPPYQLRVCGVK